MSSTIIDTAKGLSAVAAQTAMEYFRQSLSIELKDDASPVTHADKTIEAQVRDQLASLYPDHSILGEEYGAGDLTKEHVWVVDPIDGTRSFISGHPLFGFLLSYLQHGINQISVISMPALNELYMGGHMAPATLNGRPIRSSAITQLSEAILYINEGEKLFANEPEIHKRLVVSGHTMRFSYDCYPHALLAAGHVDAVVDFDLKPFDYLPLSGLIHAAGGVMSDWAGKPLDFESDGRVVSAATLELHASLLSVLSSES